MLVKVYNKGQIIIPSNIRRKYNINVGDKVDIIEDNEGIKILPIKKKQSILNLAGIFSKNKKTAITKKDINNITENSFVEVCKDEIY